MTLKPGKFYRSREGGTWCCYRVDAYRKGEEHCQAHCIRVDNHRVEYFYIDGRYDNDGKREHCLTEELP